MTARYVHWQQVWFSMVALIFGVGYTGIVESAAPHARLLPAGLNDLPPWVLFVLGAAWVGVGTWGLVSALILHRLYKAARVSIAVMFGMWAGAYFYGWVSGNPSGFIAAGLFFFVALAAATPPLWTVRIKAVS